MTAGRRPDRGRHPAPGPLLGAVPGRESISLAGPGSCQAFVRSRPRVRQERLVVLRPVLGPEARRGMGGQGLGEEVGDLEVGQDGNRVVNGQPPQPVVGVELDPLGGVGDGDDELDLAPGDPVADVGPALFVDLEEPNAGEAVPPQEVRGAGGGSGPIRGTCVWRSRRRSSAARSSRGGNTLRREGP